MITRTTKYSTMDYSVSMLDALCSTHRRLWHAHTYGCVCVRARSEQNVCEGEHCSAAPSLCPYSKLLRHDTAVRVCCIQFHLCDSIHHYPNTDAVASEPSEQPCSRRSVCDVIRERMEMWSFSVGFASVRFIRAVLARHTALGRARLVCATP